MVRAKPGTGDKYFKAHVLFYHTKNIEPIIRGGFIDSECIPVLRALNKFPGIFPFESCSGHGKKYVGNFRIFFASKDTRNLDIIRKCVATAPANGNWKVRYDGRFQNWMPGGEPDPRTGKHIYRKHSWTGKWAYTLDSWDTPVGKPAYEDANRIAVCLNRHLRGR